MTNLTTYISKGTGWFYIYLFHF